MQKDHAGSVAHLKPEGARSPIAGTTYIFGSFEMRVDAMQFFRDGQVVALPPKVFDTLLLLVRNRQRLVSKDELLQLVWHGDVVSEGSLSQCISALRKTLGDDSSQPEFIATIPRRGYRFIADVTEMGPEQDAAPAAALPSSTPFSDATLAPAGASAERQARPVRLPLWTTIATGLIALGAVTWGAFAVLRPAPPAGPLRLNLQAPFGTNITSGAVLSPDGRLAAFVAEDSRSGRVQLWVQGLDAADPRALAGTDGASRPFWSPDSRFIGFFAGGALKKVGVTSTPPQTLAMVGLSPTGGTWGPDGTILYAVFRSAIFRVDSAGGTPTPVTALHGGDKEVAHLWPEFLPDGRHFLFTVDNADPNRAGTYVGAVDAEQPRRLIGDGHATYAPPGYLVFVRDRVLMAQRFDAGRLALSGNADTIAGNVAEPTARNGATLSATAGGLLTFGGNVPTSRLTWFSRSGQRLMSLDAPADLHNPAFAGSDTTLLADGNGIWLMDLQRGTATRIVQSGTTPVPSPDGTRLAFGASGAGGVADIFVKSIGGNDAHVLLHTDQNKVVNDWTRDGRYVIYVDRNGETGRDLFALPLSGGGKPVPIAAGPANEIQAQVSPDGHSIAYVSDESGRWEIYLQAFPGGGRKRAVSSGGAAKPEWRRDGRELFYLAADRNVMAVTIDAAGEIGKSVPLFRAPSTADIGTYRSLFVPSADGQRFVVDAADTGSSREPITVLVNWTALLKH